MWTDNLREFIINYSWLATPIIAAIGWCQTFLISVSYAKVYKVAEAVEEARQRSLKPQAGEDNMGRGAVDKSTFGNVTVQRFTGE